MDFFAINIPSLASAKHLAYIRLFVLYQNARNCHAFVNIVPLLYRSNWSIFSAGVFSGSHHHYFLCVLFLIAGMVELLQPYMRQ